MRRLDAGNTNTTTPCRGSVACTTNLGVPQLRWNVANSPMSLAAELDQAAPSGLEPPHSQQHE